MVTSNPTGEARIERLITSGVIGTGGTGAPGEGVLLENNVWLLGDDASVLIVDAAHDPDAIVRAVGGRDALGILLTHGHEDHVNAAVRLAERLDTHTYLHPADLFLWEQTHPGTSPDFELVDGAEFEVAGISVGALHTPGHTPGSMCFAVPALGTVVSGDTLFRGGPGATRWAYSSFPGIIESIRTRLFPLSDDTVVRPGHGDSTAIGIERPSLDDWLARGW